MTAAAPYVETCDPSRCPCEDASCTLSRYLRAAGGRTSGVTAMAVVANVDRAAHALRAHLERTVLTPHGLTWSGWVVLWVLRTWGETETHTVAAEAGVAKATLTGVQRTLTASGLLARRVHPDDGRRVLLSLTERGQRMVAQVAPELDRAEAWLVEEMSDADQLGLVRGLRALVTRTERR